MYQLARRACLCGIVSESAEKRFHVEAKNMGWTEKEPEWVSRETSSLFEQLVCRAICEDEISLFMRTTLPKAIRLSSAMRMLHADDNTRACDIIKMYGISVYKTAKKLGDEAEFDLPCKHVSGFMDPWTYRSFQDAAFGSGYFCCNLDEIETIIQTNQRHWGGSQISATDLNETLIAGLHKQIAEITKEKEQAFNDLKGARGRLGKAEKQLAECETHMGILVRLASVVTEPQPPQKVSQKEIKEKYLAIGNTLGVDVVPPKYVDIFRNSMPAQYINQGGAPNQGEKAEKP